MWCTLRTTSASVASNLSPASVAHCSYNLLATRYLQTIQPQPVSMFTTCVSLVLVRSYAFSFQIGVYILDTT